MKRCLFFIFLLASIILGGCGQHAIKDNQIYVVQKDANKSTGDKLVDQLKTEGTIPFQEYENLSILQGDRDGQALLTISPDGTSMYLMEAIENKEKVQMVKGEPREKVRLLKVDIETKEQRIIAEDMPFISLVKWNNDGTMMALGGGERLYIYDAEKNQFLLEDKLKNDLVTYFAWSPKDDNKIYTEHPNLANGSIYYVSSQKKVEAYETKEDLYYKGKLDTDYYYGTKWYVVNEEKAKAKEKSDNINTVIVDNKGNIVKVLSEGRFRDAYQKSLVQVGGEGFGLYYLEDINHPGKIKTLTKEYIFDVKFVDGGKIAYIVANKDLEKNTFFLHIVDNKGKELEKLEVSGSTIALLPHGKTGYIGGPLWEKVDFEKNIIEGSRIQDTVDREEDIEKSKILTTIRGAMDTLYKFEMEGKKDWLAVKKYFIDSYSPEQWAYFDVTRKFKEATDDSKENKDIPYNIRIELKDYNLDIYNQRASVVIRLGAENFWGSGVGMEHALELLKIEDIWYVTGLSTFPYSPQRIEVKQKVEKYIEEAQSGKIFPGQLEGKEVEIGQIQFWRSSMPHLSPKIESANLCKVYLKVKGNGKEEIYKMLLDKKNQNYWKPTELSKDKLSYFY